MIDTLVISKDNAGNDAKRKGILLTTFMVVLSLFSLGMIYSLFSQSLAMGQDNLNISTLIAPPTIPRQKPPAPEPERARNQPDKQAVSQIITRRENIQRVSESPVNAPKTTSTEKPTSAARPDAPYRLTGRDSGKTAVSSEDQTTSRGGGDNTGIIGNHESTKVKTEPIKPEIKKTIPKPPPIAKPKKKDVIVSKGVINGEAKRLVMPAYPSAARAIRLSGKVTIQVLIDKNGRVISANSINGHKLLAPSALKAARASRFTPTFLGDQKVKVRGVIVYNFAL